MHHWLGYAGGGIRWGPSVQGLAGRPPDELGFSHALVPEQQDFDPRNGFLLRGTGSLSFAVAPCLRVAIEVYPEAIVSFYRAQPALVRHV